MWKATAFISNKLFKFRHLISTPQFLTIFSLTNPTQCSTFLLILFTAVNRMILSRPEMLARVQSFRPRPGPRPQGQDHGQELTSLVTPLLWDELHWLWVPPTKSYMTPLVLIISSVVSRTIQQSWSTTSSQNCQVHWKIKWNLKTHLFHTSFKWRPLKCLRQGHGTIKFVSIKIK